MNPSEKPYVLVHGLWHHGALWAPVARILQAHGHPVHAPTLPGFGPGDPEGGHRFSEHVDAVVRVIVDHDLTNVVLVGHSYGGAVIAAVAQQIPERIARLVFAAALVPLHGHSIAGDFPPTDRLEPGPDGKLPVPDFALLRDRFFGDTDHDTAVRLAKRLHPCPAAPLGQSLDLQGFYELLQAGRLRCSYLHGTDDTALPPGEYGFHPRQSSRLGSYRLVTLTGGHEAMLTAPELYATRLMAAGRE